MAIGAPISASLSGSDYVANVTLSTTGTFTVEARATDSLSNVNTTVPTIAITKGTAGATFPNTSADSSVPFERITDLAFDATTKSIYATTDNATTSATVSNDRVLKIDLTTGTYSTFIELQPTIKALSPAAISGIFNPRSEGIFVDNKNGRNRLIVGEFNTQSLYAFPLPTPGSGSIFSSGGFTATATIPGIPATPINSTQNSSSTDTVTLFRGVGEFGYDLMNDRLLVTANSGSATAKFAENSVNLAGDGGGAGWRVSTTDAVGTGSQGKGCWGLDYDPVNSQMLCILRAFSSGTTTLKPTDLRRITSLPTNDTALTTYTEASTITGLFADAVSINVDTARNKAVIADKNSSTTSVPTAQIIYTIPLSSLAASNTTASTTVLSSATAPNTYNTFQVLEAVHTDPSLAYALVADSGNDAIYAVDLVSGERVIICKP